MNPYLIYSHRCLINGSFSENTLRISDGIITHIYEGRYAEVTLKCHDYGNLIVMPGVIDAHVHINEPGRTTWEGFDTACKAAAIGGVTSMIEMPLNASPVTTSKKAFQEKIAATKNKLHVNCGFYGGIVPDNLKDIEELIKAGVFGIKGFLCHSGIDAFPNVEKRDLISLAPILKQYDLPLLLHCELEDEDVPNVEDVYSYTSYVASRPTRWENNAIELALSIQGQFDISVHIVHLSATDRLNQIIRHRENTKKLTVETCPHYLFFNAEEIPDKHPIYKCAPPIREKANNEKLWEAIIEGYIDFIASDHSPAPPNIKQLDTGNYFTAWGGIAGLQFTLSAFITKALEYNLPLEKALDMLTTKPASFLGLDKRKGSLAVGYDADITVLDIDDDFVVNEEGIYHRHKLTPYLGRRLKGRILHTFVNGEQVVENATLKKLNTGCVLKRTNASN